MVKGVPGTPTGIGGGFDGKKLRLFHADPYIDKVYELDVDTLKPIKTVKSPGTCPEQIGGDFDGKKLRLFNADSVAGKLYELDVDTLTPIKTVNAPSNNSRGVGGGYFTMNKKYIMHNGIKYELKEV